jgi:hypothetical protein
VPEKPVGNQDSGGGSPKDRGRRRKNQKILTR